MALLALALPLAGFAAAVLAGRALLAAPDGPPQIRAPLALPDVELIDQDGAPVRTSALHGKIVLLTFFYAECTEGCPLAVRQVQAVLQRFPADAAGADVLGLALSLDPEHDDPRAPATAAEHWQVTDPRLRLVTGTPEAVGQVLQAASVWRRARGNGAWDHANLVLVLDRAGREAFAEGGTLPDADRLADAIARLLSS